MPTGAPIAEALTEPTDIDRRSPEPEGVPPALRLRTGAYVATLSTCAGLLAVYFLTRAQSIDGARLCLAVAMVGLMVIAWLFPLPFAFQTKLYLDTSIIFASILLFDPGVAIVIAATGTAIAHAIRRRTAPESIFNVAQTALQAGIGGLVLGLGGWSPQEFRFEQSIDVVAIAVVGLVIYLVNTILVAGVIAIQESVDPLRVWREATLDTSPSEILSHLSQLGIGVIAAITTNAQPWSVVLFVLPSAAIYASFSRHLQLRQLDADRLRGAEEELEVAHQDIVREAGFDHLTELPNGRRLLEQLDRGFAEPSQRETGVALLTIDMDRFQGRQP